MAAAVFVRTSMQRYTPKFLISFGIAYFSSLDYGYQKSQYLCRFSDFKVRTKFLIGHHEILKRYETFSKKGTEHISVQYTVLPGLNKAVAT